jgi:hypothetical protein
MPPHLLQAGLELAGKLAAGMRLVNLPRHLPPLPPVLPLLRLLLLLLLPCSQAVCSVKMLVTKVCSCSCSQ